MTEAKIKPAKKRKSAPRKRKTREDLVPGKLRLYPRYRAGRALRHHRGERDLRRCQSISTQGENARGPSAFARGRFGTSQRLSGSHRRESGRGECAGD